MSFIPDHYETVNWQSETVLTVCIKYEDISYCFLFAYTMCYILDQILYEWSILFLFVNDIFTYVSL